MLLAVYLCYATNLCAQSYEQEINDQVWKLFINTFNNRDTDGFMALHSKEVVRSPRDAKVVLNWQDYYNEQKKGDELGKTSGIKRTLELRFTERISNNNTAIDVGIYKTTVLRENSKEQTFYGRFHAVLRKENTVWKILVDTDSSEGASIGEKHFQDAKAMD